MVTEVPLVMALVTVALPAAEGERAAGDGSTVNDGGGEAVASGKS
jgi:hypothetical protein